jgi:bacteriocin-like protein
MNKRSENKTTQNETKSAKDELSEQDLNKVSGGDSFDIEQVLNIGSQGSGAGAGKVTFNPFSITRE